MAQSLHLDPNPAARDDAGEAGRAERRLAPWTALFAPLEPPLAPGQRARRPSAPSTGQSRRFRGARRPHLAERFPSFPSRAAPERCALLDVGVEEKDPSVKENTGARFCGAARAREPLLARGIRAPRSAHHNRRRGARARGSASRRRPSARAAGAQAQPPPRAARSRRALSPPARARGDADAARDAHFPPASIRPPRRSTSCSSAGLEKRGKCGRSRVAHRAHGRRSARTRRARASARGAADAAAQRAARARAHGGDNALAHQRHGHGERHSERRRAPSRSARDATTTTTRATTTTTSAAR